MLKTLKNLPVLDADAFAATTADWKKQLQKTPPGSSRVVIEWGVSHGPDCFVFPAGKRSEGVCLTPGLSHAGSDERWADFLEFTFVPSVEKALKDAGIVFTTICTDLRPLQIMRARRRTIESAAHAKTGVAAH